jgi:type I restriction enzyme S subunit
MSWRTQRLDGLIATLESGSRPKGGATLDTGEVPSVGGENILQSGGVSLESVKRVPIAFFNRMTKGHLCQGDVLINKDGAQTGKVGWYHPASPTAACINEHVFLLRGNADAVTQGYLYYSLLSEEGQAQIRLQVSGSAQPGLKAGFTKGVRVQVPDDLDEQDKIVEVLSTIDRAIGETEATIAKQQRIKTGLMQDLLTRGIDEHGNLRTEPTHEFKDSPLGRIPAEWELSTIGGQFEIQLGKMLSQKSRQGHNPLPYLGNKNVQWDTADLSDVERMDFNDAEQDKFRLRIGDILVCEGGEVGRTCVWHGELQDCFYQKAIHRLRPKHGYLPDLFPSYMRWAVRNGLLSDFTSQSSIAHLTKEKLAAVPIFVPTPSEQHRIWDVLGAADTGLETQGQLLSKLLAVKRGAMQDLLSGDRSVAALLESREAVTA